MIEKLLVKDVGKQMGQETKKAPVTRHAIE